MVDTTVQTLVIATRGSALALWQATHVQEGIAQVPSRLEIVRTTGDHITDVPLARIGGRGLFTRELDAAVLDGRADCAVHSLKDLPTRLADGLTLAAILEREDARDAWLAADGFTTIDRIAAGSRVGTSSLRRRAQLLARRPDLDVRDVRGNLDTRLTKLKDGQYDALILALAGLRRLGRADAVTQVLRSPEWLPAPGQGAVAVVARTGDEPTLQLLASLDHQDTRTAVSAERALLRHLEGGCQVPIGTHACIVGGRVRMDAVVADPDGHTVLRASGDADVGEAADLGIGLARKLLDDGAHRILDQLRGSESDDVPAVTLP
ncbi:MAG TPA: hydroxymethylbilane synthase [Longimicrobiales bacterium]